MPNSLDINITIGFNQAAENVLTSLIEAIQGNLSADDQKALSDLVALLFALQGKADTADGKFL